ncbi:hypothetical protein FCMLKIFP_00096 [Pseudomonas phage Ka3]|nr:hypothetical protein [Pseudomonas phage vB_PaeS_TUMS_P6]UNI72008.1 hypothetical protein [Pseudomonas phage vB_PaeP_TUMS_P10]WQZ52446.1 hypothetical protein FCMLKIFP_00096 [Pseudomonas phage Ka3]
MGNYYLVVPPEVSADEVFEDAPYKPLGEFEGWNIYEYYDRFSINRHHLRDAGIAHVVGLFPHQVGTVTLVDVGVVYFKSATEEVELYRVLSSDTPESTYEAASLLKYRKKLSLGEATIRGLAWGMKHQTSNYRFMEQYRLGKLWRMTKLITGD